MDNLASSWSADAGMITIKHNYILKDHLLLFPLLSSYFPKNAGE